MATPAPRSRRFWLLAASGATGVLAILCLYLGWIGPHLEFSRLRVLAETERTNYRTEEVIPESVRKWVANQVPSASPTVDDWSKTGFLSYEAYGLEDLKMRELVALLPQQTRIEKLVFQRCSLKDSHLIALSSLSRLTTLELSLTEVTCRELPMFPRLRSLSLDRCPLDTAGLEQIAQLPALENLELRTMTLPDDALELLQSSHLRRLHLLNDPSWADNRPRVYQSLAKIATLEQLHIRHCDPSGAQALKGCPRLTHLHIEKSDLDVAELQEFPALTHLEADWAMPVRVESLRRLRPLISLGLAHSWFGDVELEALSQSPAAGTLIRLNLSGTRITDAGLKHLAKFPKLTRTCVGDTAVTAAGAQRAAAAFGKKVTRERPETPFDSAE